MGLAARRLSFVNERESILIVQPILAGIARYHRAEAARVQDCKQTMEEAMPATHGLAKALVTLLATVTAAGLVAAQTVGAPDLQANPRAGASQENSAAKTT